jgi:hypothetical protein
MGQCHITASRIPRSTFTAVYQQGQPEEPCLENLEIPLQRGRPSFSLNDRHQNFRICGQEDGVLA